MILSKLDNTLYCKVNRVSLSAAMEEYLTSLVHSLVKDGVFGDVENADVQIDNPKCIGPQYSSSLVFVNLSVQCASGKQVIPLVSKQQPKTHEAPDQFCNELLMYQEIIPTLGLDQESYPKLYYGRVKEEFPEKNVLIFENLKHKNYLNSKQTPFLDFEHIVLAMKRIAKFHSLSYIVKHGNKSRLLDMTKNLKITEFFDKDVIEFEKVHFAGIERGVKAFQKSQLTDEVFDRLLNALKHSVKVWRKLWTTEEPFGVVCHGDFCNNNVMYRYDEGGSPTDCILLDFQKSLYGSPAMDLSFYLYMHTTYDMREKHWDEFLEIYWKTLRESVPGHIGVPPFQEFLDQFASRAIYGYIIASFFLPMLMDLSIKLWSGLSSEDEIEAAKTMGGPDAEEKLADIVSHLYHRKYIHSFLDFAKRNDLVK